MVYKGSDLTIIELLSALHAKVVDLSKRKGAELRQELEPCLQQYVSLYKQCRFILNVSKYVDLRCVLCTPVQDCTLTIYNTGVSQIGQYIEKIGDILQFFKKCFNTAATINQLPLELLTRIFKVVQVQRLSKERFPHPFAIKRFHKFSEAEDAISWVPLTMHICNYWRNVVLSTPTLWNYIQFNAEEREQDIWHYFPPPSLLLLSHLTPLYITVHFHTHPLFDSEPTKLYDALRNINDRVEALQICWEGRFKALILDVLQYAFPQLTSLTLCLNMGGLGRSTPAAVPATIFGGGELPQLRRLSLWFYTSWSHHKIPNLTHISLHHQEVRPSINGFLDLLESTPYLEFLSLCNAGPRIAQGDLLPQRMVSLPSLRFAQFESKSSEEEHNTRILECLMIQQLTRCSLLGQSRVRFNRPPISPDVIEKLFTYINPEGVIELHVYQYKRDAYGLQIDASRISIQTMLYTLVTVPAARCSNIQYLHLVSTVRIPVVKWSGFPKLLSITCYDSLNGINELVMSLSRQTRNEWPCPLLQTIYLRVGEQLPDLLRVKKSEDREFVHRVLSHLPEHMVVPRDHNSYQVAIELRPALPEEFQMEASVTFPLN